MPTHRHNTTCNETVSECTHGSMNRTVHLKPVVRVDYHAPKRKRPPVTVCLVTMITDETPTLRLWVYHHVYSLGIKQIRGYYTHEPSVLRVPRIVGVRFAHERGHGGLQPQRNRIQHVPLAQDLHLLLRHALQTLQRQRHV